MIFVLREKMMATVRAFENTDHSLGREGTVFFFLEYLNYLDQVNAELENTERQFFHCFWLPNDGRKLWKGLWQRITVVSVVNVFLKV